MSSVFPKISKKLFSSEFFLAFLGVPPLFNLFLSDGAAKYTTKCIKKSSDPSKAIKKLLKKILANAIIE